MPKRKYSDSAHPEAPENRSPKCILHTSSISDYGNFTPLSSVKGDASDRLQEFNKIRDLRLQHSHDSPHRMQSVCDQIPTTLPTDLQRVGYHRGCYQHFTRHLNRLQDEQHAATTSERHHSPRKSVSAASHGPIFPPECIFCETLEIKVGRKTERTETFSSYRKKGNAWEEIEQRAQKMGLTRVYRQVKDKDLFAVEAKHHPSCLKSFRTSFYNYERGIHRAEEPQDSEQIRFAAVHEKAFGTIVDHVKAQVVEKNDVLQLSSLRLLYVDELRRSGYEDSNYRSEKLLNRLRKHPINNHLSFTKVDRDEGGSVSFWLVYSSNITVANALAQAYALRSKDRYQDVAFRLRDLILRAYKNSKNIPWPPTANDMELSSEEILPPDLVRFLSIVMAGKEDTETSEKTKRLVFSIGQDLCRVVSDGKWKLPKHILLCVTVRHLFRSKQLTTILNRLGHSETYNFGLEMETALTKALDDVSTHLTPQILTGDGNVVFHCEWDNLNKTTTNVHGSNIVNSAGGIMLQEVKPDFESTHMRTLPLIDKTKHRSIHVDTPETLPPLYFTRIGPKFPQNASFTPPAENDAIYASQMQLYYMWLFCRYIGSGGTQSMPGLGGFVSAIGTVPYRKSTVDYFTPIHQPITDNAVVHELLKRSEAATVEVGQKWVLNTFDLGVCMKALPIIWRWPDEFAYHVVTIGPFHTSMNYIGMITNHKMRGSGYTEILLEAQMVTSGSLKGVLSGKAYAKSLFCLKTVCEAMERLLMEHFIEEENVPIADPAALLNLIQSCDRKHLEEAIDDPSILTLIERYCNYEEKVRKGHLGKTATFWMSFVDHCHLVFMLLLSIKTNNLQLFHKCNGDMAVLFFAFDGQNYSRFVHLNVKSDHKLYYIHTNACN